MYCNWADPVFYKDYIVYLMNHIEYSTKNLPLVRRKYKNLSKFCQVHITEPYDELILSMYSIFIIYLQVHSMNMYIFEKKICK